MRIKRNKLDIVFSNLVRERSNWTCEFSEKHFPPDATRGLEAAHIYGRARRGMRWLPLNCIALSTGAHMRFTANPFEFYDWVEAHIGKEAMETLRIMASQTFKFSKPEFEDIYQNLKAELVRIEGLRKDGETGRLEFISPYPD